MTRRFQQMQAEERVALAAMRRQVLLDHQPDDVQLDSQVVVDDDVSKSDQSAPRNFGLCGLSTESLGSPRLKHIRLRGWPPSQVQSRLKPAVHGGIFDRVFAPG